ncbi:hypothetical protein [Methylobacterium haplocladii]|uniref:Uncharacterized protein n=1 Tax=Methylobacterium haplocladii TaxID=1176176 RepID=A0A512ISD8_9HYPH|nr:hypothetical protein [Methylobacterium haplocladii]GEP00601.1 hypothetical protein MHA02_29880 [Methylobacterium haplocladii]GLS57749.1 hypothetical protein GCM10007887_04050 [Methylobacterium haplocladii]
MNDGEAPQPEDRIENHRPYQYLAAYVKLRNDISEIWYDKSADALKHSVEFSKLIITNLQIINAGGLLAVPTVSASVLGLTGLNHTERLLYLGLPMAVFALGLLLATLCSYFTYRNYLAHAHTADAQAWRSTLEVENALPNLALDRIEQTIRNLEEIDKLQLGNLAAVQNNYIRVLVCGWLSVTCFVAACIILALFSK